MPRTCKSGSRPGFTLPELLIATVIALVSLFALVNFTRLNSHMWHKGLADTEAQKDGEAALQDVSAKIRLARRVDQSLSTSTKLVLQMPKLNSSGGLEIPLADGQKVAYYAGPAPNVTTGDTSQMYLWRSIDGSLDTSWCMSGGRPRFPLTSSGLTFTYHGVSEPESVTVRIVTSAGTGGTRTFVASQETMLRNRGLQGG